MSNSGAWGPTPEGVDLSEDQNTHIIGSVVAIMVIGIASVVLRMFTRLMHTGHGLAADDYMILFAAVRFSLNLIMGIGTAVCCLISVPWGGGKHLWSVTHGEFTKLYQTTYAFVIVYITCISATKISILLFYRRIFGKGLVWHVVFALACAHWAEVTITWLAGCRPIDYYWRQYTDPTAKGTCIDAPLFYFCNGIIGLVIDVAILLVPLPTSTCDREDSSFEEEADPIFFLVPRSSHASHTVWKLNLPTTKKIFVGGILLLGGFVCVASAVRIVMMDQLVKSADFTWAMSKVFIWSCCEPWVGILCACLPTYAPLVRQLWRRGGSSYADMPDDRRYASNRGRAMGHSIKIKSSRRRGLGDETFAAGDDDELELTVDISTAQKQAPPTSSSSRSSSKTKVDDKSSSGGLYLNEIVVRKDFSWTSSS
ncbi:hypothetical protein B0H63DRAFT_508501 [Podospora didyma]|uniref:Rhodopsin domain-containing protein n=1 Tax=Podospora didyma TaxID=330526 RepID=A0AAE0NRN9_9PEZI|nr:hypothetical protein B0H63DRAFT_508501 [Podospora didyma]